MGCRILAKLLFVYPTSKVLIYNRRAMKILLCYDYRYNTRLQYTVIKGVFTGAYVAADGLY
jgi:hypothetical protein